MLRMKMKVAYFALICMAIVRAPIPLHCQEQRDKTSFLSCWEGNKGIFQSRRATTPIFKSTAGLAYGEVIAEASTGSDKSQYCKNTVRVFYSTDGAKYRVVYQKTGNEDLNGIGIHLVGWSNTKKLLIELTEWRHESDADILKSALIFGPDSSQVTDTHLQQALQRVFGTECEFDTRLVGWRPDNTINVRISRTPLTESYDQVFCVKKPTLFIFDPHTGNVKHATAR